MTKKGVGPVSKQLVAMATSLVGSKSSFRLFNHSQSSTNPENFVKIVLVAVEIIGLTEITKIYFKNRTANHKPSSLALRAERGGAANDSKWKTTSSFSG